MSQLVTILPAIAKLEADSLSNLCQQNLRDIDSYPGQSGSNSNQGRGQNLGAESQRGTPAEESKNLMDSMTGVNQIPISLDEDMEMYVTYRISRMGDVKLASVD